MGTPAPPTREPEMNDTPSYDIAEDDAYIASTIATFDPIYGVSGPTAAIGNVQLPTSIRAEGLSPAMRDPILAAMAKVPAESRPALEAKMVREALENNSLDLKVKCGPGADATEYQRECFSVVGDIHRLNTERLRLSRDLVEVSHWTTTIDPVTGVSTPLAVDKMVGERRKGWEERIRLIDNQVDALQGAEGKLRKDRALYNSVETFKRKQAEVDDHFEIQKRATAMVREERIQTAAETRARMMRKV